MRCPRCAGLLLQQRHLDYDERGAVFIHCINCGHCSDPLIEKNRALTQEERTLARRRAYLKPATSMEVEL